MPNLQGNNPMPISPFLFPLPQLAGLIQPVATSPIAPIPAIATPAMGLIQPHPIAPIPAIATPPMLAIASSSAMTTTSIASSPASRL